MTYVLWFDDLYKPSNYFKCYYYREVIAGRRPKYQPSDHRLSKSPTDMGYASPIDIANNSPSPSSLNNVKSKKLTSKFALAPRASTSGTSLSSIGKKGSERALIKSERNDKQAKAGKLTGGAWTQKMIWGIGEP